MSAQRQPVFLISTDLPLQRWFLPLLISTALYENPWAGCNVVYQDGLLLISKSFLWGCAMRFLTSF